MEEERCMQLVMDIGNTHMVIGLYDGDTLVRDWRMHTNAALTEDEFHVMIRNLFALNHLLPENIGTVVISCVVPPIMRMIEVFCRKYLNLAPCWVDAGNAGIPILYDNPAEVGADRLVNAVAAHHKYPTSLIVIDFGTATTFDAISAEGAYLGGAISPGIGIAAEALFQRASKLPRVDLIRPPLKAIGKDTESSMKAGILFGYAGLVDGMVSRIRAEMASESLHVIATGGLAPLMQDISQTIEYVEPHLTLEGLRIISNRMHSAG
jgi:type III pantothenate kinase